MQTNLISFFIQKYLELLHFHLSITVSIISRETEELLSLENQIAFLNKE